MPTLDWIGKKAVVNHPCEVPYSARAGVEGILDEFVERNDVRADEFGA